MTRSRVLTRFGVFVRQVFTSVPPLAIGLFDRTVSSDSMLKYPKLYKASQNAEIYNTKVPFVIYLHS